MAHGVNYVHTPRGAIQGLNFVWDVNTLTWVPETQPTGGGSGGAVSQGTGGSSAWLVNINNVPHVVIDSATLGTVAVSVASLPLPANAAQETGGNLASIKTNLDSLYGVENRYTTALDYDANNNPIYIGMAAQGSAKGAALWLIRKLTFDVSNNVTNIVYANGSQSFNQIWDNRASLSYS